MPATGALASVCNISLPPPHQDCRVRALSRKFRAAKRHQPGRPSPNGRKPSLIERPRLDEARWRNRMAPRSAARGDPSEKVIAMKAVHIGVKLGSCVSRLALA